jgi:hypothetical protein
MAINGLRERGRQEDAQVPPINQFRAQEEYAVEEQHGVCGGSHNRRAQRHVRTPVVDRLLEPSVSARTERIEQNPVQRVVVVGIEIAAFSRVLAARIAQCPGKKEALDRRANDFAALPTQDDGQLVG